jgi:hypothetical protein
MSAGAGPLVGDGPSPFDAFASLRRHSYSAKRLIAKCSAAFVTPCSAAYSTARAFSLGV